MATITCPKCKNDYWDSYSKCPTCGEINPQNTQSFFQGFMPKGRDPDTRRAKLVRYGKTFGESMRIRIVEKSVQLAIFFAVGAILIGVGGFIGGPYVGIATILAGLYSVLPNEAEILERVLQKEQKIYQKDIRLHVT